MFIGRSNELGRLHDAYKSSKGELVVIYGRRRIGKSSLVKNFAQNKPYYFKFEAIEEKSSNVQIKQFIKQLKEQTKDSLIKSINFNTWDNVLTFLTERVVNKERGEQKLILFFDELQWMAAGRSKLTSLLKYYWDNFWKDKNVMLILCGSIASFMVKKVIKSKALYGRITYEILLKGLLPNEAVKIFKGKRSREEILKYLLVFGGVPKYLEEIDLSRSFNQNIKKMCFSKDGLMVNEPERVFYSQFREHTIYNRIITSLCGRILSLDNISKILKMPSGGGLKSYLDNLENAEIIRSYIPFDRPLNSKFRKYSLSDEYLIFYFKYIKPNLRIIKESTSKNVFEKLTKDSIDLWLGFAFERFCIKHASYLAKKMGFEDDVLIASPYFGAKDKKFQIDLLYKRDDKVITICEIKYKNKQIDTTVIPDVERKCSLIEVPKGYSIEKSLISLYGPDNSLRNASYFDYYISLENII